LSAAPHQQLGELLLGEGKIRETDLQRALQDKGSKLIGDILIQNQACSEDDVLDALSKQLGIWRVRLSELVINPSIIGKLKAKVALHYQVVPLFHRGPALVVATTDPQNHEKLDELKVLLGCPVKPMLCGRAELEAALNRYYGVSGDAPQAVSAKPIAADLAKLSVRDLGDDKGDSVVDFVDSMLREARRHHATDIHLEPTDGDLEMRMRIDGTMTTVHMAPAVRSFKDAIVARIRSVAGLKEATCGRFSAAVDGETIDLRVSILPSIHGDAVNIHLAGRSVNRLELTQVGLAQYDRDMIERILARPQGLMLFVGPRRSGKSTTIYAAMRVLPLDRVKVIAVEDPVEYALEGVTQLHADRGHGASFAALLRSALHHDPDVLVAGDIHDGNTARVAVQAALEGHLVLGTLHAADAIRALLRLCDMGVEPGALMSAVECVVAQRLVRSLCDACKAKSRLDVDVLGGMWPTRVKPPRKVYVNRGCDACARTGYRGRIGIFEVLRPDREVKTAIVAGADSRAIRDMLREQGMRTLLEDGFAKVAEGLTTVDEVIRATLGTDVDD